VAPSILAYQLQSLPPILHMLQIGSMSNCSKAPWGLFVLVRTDGIFTANALSPRSSSRQFPYHYSIRAGLNLPDKEFRYLRTVIVTAAVHWGFSSSREALPLTFQHRAGVSPYTSTFVFAETYVFGKQLHGIFCCSRHCCRRALFRSYGRCIAEFLNEESRVRHWSTRPEHLCRFAVRTACIECLKAFLVTVARLTQCITAPRVHSPDCSETT
jgi:hypothetical protein